MRNTAAKGGMSQRKRPSRRTVLQTLGSLGTATIAASAVAGARTGRLETRAGDNYRRSNGRALEDVPKDATRYIAVVDRIVDGEHVVLLLEKECELVDQHVTPRSQLDEVEESDILIVVIEDEELLTAQQIPERPEQCR